MTKHKNPSFNFLSPRRQGSRFSKHLPILRSGEDVDVEAEEHISERSERRMWSREEFLHERCATPADEAPARWVQEV